MSDKPLIEKVLESSNIGKPVGADENQSRVDVIPFAPDGAQVFREYKPRTDSIEYTIFWRENGSKMRMDFEITSNELENVQVENYVLQIAMAKYDDNDYVNASDPLGPKKDTWNAGFDNVPAESAEPSSIEPVDEMIKDSDEDPFSAANAPGLNLIVNMRIYDVLLGLYLEQNPERAQALMDIHATGKVLGSLPTFDPEQT